MFAYAVTLIAVYVIGIAIVVTGFLEILGSDWMKKIIPPLWGRLIAAGVYVSVIVCTICAAH